MKQPKETCFCDYSYSFILYVRFLLHFHWKQSFFNMYIYMFFWMCTIIAYITKQIWIYAIYIIYAFCIHISYTQLKEITFTCRHYACFSADPTMNLWARNCVWDDKVAELPTLIWPVVIHCPEKKKIKRFFIVSVRTNSCLI